MRIGFFGGGPQALVTLQAIQGTDDLDIAFVHPRGADDPIVGEFATPAEIEIMPFARINETDAVEYVRSKKLGLIVSINCKQIFHPPLLAASGFGAINVHNGLLPRQRGGGGAFAAIVNGENCGVTVHFVDEGIDTGDIIDQREIPVQPTDTMADIQRRMFALTPAMVIDAAHAIAEDRATRRAQKDAPFYYVPAKAPWDELIDWSQTSQAIYDKVRARTPGPSNFYLFEDETHFVVEVELEPRLLSYRNTVGQVLGTDPERGVLVKTGDSGMWIKRVRTEASETPFTPRHPMASMLCHHPDREIVALKRRYSDIERRLALLERRFGEED